MSAERKTEVGVSHDERRESGTEILQVQNVALADATAKAGVSAWTPAMFKVRRCDESRMRPCAYPCSFTCVCWSRRSTPASTVTTGR